MKLPGYTNFGRSCEQKRPDLTRMYYQEANEKQFKVSGYLSLNNTHKPD
jgi:hypothetical protein